MTLSNLDVVHVIAATAVALLAAHTLAHVFLRLRQPAVIGELLAGVLLGPTLLGILAPQLGAALFPTTGITSVVLGSLGQFGLLLLLFVTGGELLVRVSPAERRTVGWVAVSGLALPLVVGALVALLLDHRDYSGPAGSRATFALVFGIAVAVTSIPVISRIMLDLGLLRTAFARLVLGVAVIEDIVLYVALAVVLSLVHTSRGDDFGLWGWVGIDSSALSVTYHIVVTLSLFAIFLTWGPRVFRSLLGRTNAVEQRSPVAFRLAFLIGVVLLCLTLGVNPVFGALLAGVAVRRGDGLPPASPSGLAVAPDGRDGRDGPDRRDGQDGRGGEDGRDPWETIRQFSLAFFIPIYFVTVGLQLDLVHGFDPVFFLWFFVLCCTLKTASIWCGARLAGQPAGRATDLAAALNARGGPGIVLASVTLEAGVVNESFFASIVVLSVLTSQVAGFWLDRRRAALLRELPPPAAGAGAPTTMGSPAAR